MSCVLTIDSTEIFITPGDGAINSNSSDIDFHCFWDMVNVCKRNKCPWSYHRIGEMKAFCLLTEPGKSSRCLDRAKWRGMGWKSRYLISLDWVQLGWPLVNEEEKVQISREQSNVSRRQRPAKTSSTFVNTART